MNQVATIEQHRPKRSLIDTMSAGYNMDPGAFAKTVRATCMPPNSTDEEFAAFLLVAHQHGLNPVTREIYAFPKKGGGIQPIVGIDGWMTLINSHPQSDGIEFQDHFDEKGKLSAITCRIYRKDRQRPTEVTEYMAECLRPTEPWQKWPARMLRHKAAIQCARYAFGFAGIIDPEEAERSPEVITGSVVAPPPVALTRPTEPATVDHVAESIDADQPEEEPIDYGDYFERLQEAMNGAGDEESVEEVWTDFDPEATFEGDPTSRELADLIKKRRLAALHPINAG
jgi:phage recombination protein Bet